VTNSPCHKPAEFASEALLLCFQDKHIAHTLLACLDADSLCAVQTVYKHSKATVDALEGELWRPLLLREAAAGARAAAGGTQAPPGDRHASRLHHS